jgi:hypothetical protein
LKNLSFFEINRFDKIEEKEKEQNYIIYLNYLGKYKKLFKGMRIYLKKFQKILFIHKKFLKPI